jgi:hypothetical protein
MMGAALPGGTMYLTQVPGPRRIAVRDPSVVFYD